MWNRLKRGSNSKKGILPIMRMIQPTVHFCEFGSIEFSLVFSLTCILRSCRLFWTSSSSITNRAHWNKLSNFLHLKRANFVFRSFLISFLFVTLCFPMVKAKWQLHVNKKRYDERQQGIWQATVESSTLFMQYILIIWN